MSNIERLKRGWPVILLGIALGCLYLWPVMRVDIKDDEGLYAQQAIRILHGQLPGADFPHMYTGGQLLLTAGLFALLGSSLLTLRIGLALTFAALAFLVYLLFRRLMPVGWSLLATVAVSALSICQYPYTNATWNALVLTLLIVWLLMCVFEGMLNRRWLAAAGMALGLAVLMKQNVALYTAFSIYGLLLLDLLFPAKAECPASSPVMQKLGRGLVWAGGAVILLYLFFILRHHPQPHLLLMYGLPSAGLPMLFGWLIRKLRPSADRFGLLAGRSLWLLAGMIVPLLFWLGLYMLHGGLPAVRAMLEATLLRPWYFYRDTIQDYLSGMKEQAALVLVLLSAGLWLLQGRWRWVGAGLMAIALLLMTSGIQVWNEGIFWTWMQLPFWVLLIGLVLSALCLQNATKDGLSPMARWELSLYITGVFVYLSTYPLFAAPFVACNVIPFAMLLMAAFYRAHQQAQSKIRPLILIVPVLISLYGLLSIYHYDGRPPVDFLARPLAPFTGYLSEPGGGLSLTGPEYEKREAVLNFLKSHARSTDNFFILADDVPELYFLSGRGNPTPYDYYLYSLPPGGTENLIESLERHQVRFVIVEPERPSLYPIRPEVMQYVQSHYRPRYRLPAGWLVLERNQIHP